ncbi:hypothetical protein GGI25_003670 [Coemansia spiralis]|uniref:Uncharacterized protein n=2 Tax=Coemansia TaxID=4863 RepID=A0A9W8G6P8_9FUNG|nr:hypothetical protein BX070DRAFT_136033 [Coemansia spiralis]KAJ1991998.1 hypothetical protein EDC05_003153 [Coemansia umbellata]KAJ2625367.1 hypothetical protein GGI26_000838 [Coemansia sp. RSA 1358]KAJ2676164.1 hypothetical protein GGI25_003670 [Coemansia spiralis]
MRITTALITLIAAAYAAPLAVRQTLVGSPEAEDKQVNGPVAIDHPNINNGAMKEGSIDSSTSLNGAAIIGASGNVLTDENTNVDFHDNLVENPTINLASDTVGGAVVGSGNQIFGLRANIARRTVFKRQAPVDVNNVNAPAAVNDPTVNNGNMKEGTTDASLSLNGSDIVNPVGNSLAQVNDNTEIADNNFVDPTWNQISNNNGPALAGDGNVFIPINNEGMIVNLDPNFLAAQQANQLALINHFTHQGQLF